MKNIDLDEILQKIDCLLESLDSVIVAIDGNSGAGKSKLADALEKLRDCNVFHMDHFFLPPWLKTEDRMKETGGNVDYARFRQEVIEGLKSGKEFEYRIYNCKIQDFGKSITVTPKRLNIVEGVYSMHPTLAENYQLKIFLSIDAQEQSARILKRNGQAMLRRFLNEWIPLEDRYFKEMRIPEQCDLIYKG